MCYPKEQEPHKFMLCLLLIFKKSVTSKMNGLPWDFWLGWEGDKRPVYLKSWISLCRSKVVGS